MTTEIDPDIRAVQVHFEAQRARHLADAQKAADEAAAMGDEWWRAMHQREADRLRAYRFSWETEQSTP